MFDEEENRKVGIELNKCEVVLIIGETVSEGVGYDGVL